MLGSFPLLLDSAGGLMAWQKLFGEQATTKIAAIFETEEVAITASAALHSVSGVQANQLRVIKPHETSYAHKLEPESKGIARTAIRAHLILGAAGVLVGVIVWALLYSSGIPAVESSPVYTASAVIFLTTIAGLLLGGLVTARPDHQLVIQRVQTAVEEGRWSLVVHPRTPEQCEEILAVLAQYEADVIRSV